jgi:hypothetical protein
LLYYEIAPSDNAADLIHAKISFLSLYLFIFLTLLLQLTADLDEEIGDCEKPVSNRRMAKSVAKDSCFSLFCTLHVAPFIMFILHSS